MEPTPKRKSVRWAAAALTATAIVSAGCGSGGNGGKTSQSKAAGDPESAYCDEARRWAIHEMAPVDDSDPVAFKKYWNEYLAFVDNAHKLAPTSIRDDWDVKVQGEAAITPILVKYDYNVPALMESGTDEEKAVTEAPANVQDAQDIILGYESGVCGAQFPIAADVSFADETPGPYCEVVAAENERIAKVFGAGAKPDEVKAFMDGEPEMGDKLAAAAPDSIKKDVVAVNDWTEGRQRAAFERHGWDLRKTILDGTPQDRADVNYADPAIRSQFARVAAYHEQVCGG
jgi:hypothetical protein